MAEQLRCAGVIEAIRISRAAYPNRMARKEFNKRWACACACVCNYACLTLVEWVSLCGVFNDEMYCPCLLSSLGVLEALKLKFCGMRLILCYCTVHERNCTVNKKNKVRAQPHTTPLFPFFLSMTFFCLFTLFRSTPPSLRRRTEIVGLRHTEPNHAHCAASLMKPYSEVFFSASRTVQ